MTIAEPMTALTDWTLAAIALVCAARLRVDPPQRSVACWRMAFVAMAVGSIAGGLSHALLLSAPQTFLRVLWKVTTLSLGVAIFFMLAATAWSRLGRGGSQLLTGLAMLQFVIYSIWMLGHDDFLWVIVNYGSAMLCVAAVHAATYRRAPVAARWILAGIGIAAVGAAVQALRITPHLHFNHNDLFHVIQMASLVVLYRGARLARDNQISDLGSQISDLGFR